MDGFSALGNGAFVEWLFAEEAGSDGNRREP